MVWMSLAHGMGLNFGAHRKEYNKLNDGPSKDMLLMS